MEVLALEYYITTTVSIQSNAVFSVISNTKLTDPNSQYLYYSQKDILKSNGTRLIIVCAFLWRNSHYMKS